MRIKKEDAINEEKDKSTKERKRMTIKKDTEIINKSVEFSLIEVIFIVLITGIAVSVASGIIVYNNYDKLNQQVVSASNNEISEFVDNYNKILNNYVEEVDKSKLIEAAIEGMYNHVGDEYTMYINNEDTSDFQEQLHGEYTGIGIEITTLMKSDKQSTYVKVTKVFKNSPAEKSGIKVGDIIIKIDDMEVFDGNTLSTTIKKGEKETYNITYIRDGKENTLTLKRERVIINSVHSQEIDNVGYIKIDTFSANTDKQVKEAIDGINKSIKSLVIDLRDNTGGYLDTAYDVSNLFVEKGKVIYQIKDRNNKIESFKANSNVYRKFDKIVVLINEQSASASEILTLALKESANATIVGTKSFGKGTVQETGSLSSGSMIKYTKAYWLSPKGNSINKIGITPDIEVTNINKQLEESIKAAK